jgi:hypothetical protein
MDEETIREEIRGDIKKDPKKWKWVWRSGPFAGQFADAYIENTSLDTGGFTDWSITALCSLMK